MTDERRPAFGIFEGGGAKGIAHVGALAAAEANGFDFIGVAGASAGAIVATLVALGFSARDIIDPDHRDANLLHRQGVTPVSLFGEEDWRRFQRLRAQGRRIGWTAVFGGLPLSLLLFPRTTWSLRRIWAERGFFSTDRIRDFVNFVARERLLDLHADAGLDLTMVPERIRFRDLDFETFPELRPLKIVVTDLASGRLVLFSREMTPDAELGEAVAASIAIPLVFKPVRMRSYEPAGPYVDGGLVSNLPSWVFADEKIAFERANPREPPVPVLAFTLEDEPHDAQEKAAMDFPAFVTRTIRTAILGSQGVSQGFIQDLYTVRLVTGMKVLDFDTDWGQARACYNDGRRCAARLLMATLKIKPDRVRVELQHVTEMIRSAFDEARAAAGQPPVRHLRAKIVLPFGVSSFRVVHAYNMDDDADDRLVFDGRAVGPPQAFAAKTAVHVALGGHARPPETLQYMTKYERALVRRELMSMICVPIFDTIDSWALRPADRPRPLGVLCLDSDENLKPVFDDPGIRQLLARQSTILSVPLKLE